MTYLLLQVLVLMTTAVVFTASLKCNKMIVSAKDNSANVVNNDVVVEMGRYVVRTTERTDSDPVKNLVSKLRGASDIKYRHKKFTAILQPRDLKKVIITLLNASNKVFSECVL